MTRRSTKLFKAALSALHYSRADEVLAPFAAGDGVIFMLHQVTPEPPRAFEPNRILRVTPDFLEDVIEQVRAAGFDIIALDDVPERIASNENTRPFAVFTLDDGYKDNLEYAYPLFKRLDVPFTIYVPTDFADGNGDLWWLTLEEAIRHLPRLSVEMDGESHDFSAATVAEKDHAFERIYWWLRQQPEDDARAFTHHLADAAGVDWKAFCRELVMRWDDVRALAQDPLVTIGAHTRSHYALAKLPEPRMRDEIMQSKRRIEAELATPCDHFSYPYGCENSAGEREFAFAESCGFKTAVTTRKGMLNAGHAGDMMALPRLSLNGDFQDTRYVKVLLSGVPFAFWNAWKRIKSQRLPDAAA